MPEEHATARAQPFDDVVSTQRLVVFGENPQDRLAQFGQPYTMFVEPGTRPGKRRLQTGRVIMAPGRELQSLHG